LVAYERFEEARQASRPQEELTGYLNAAIASYQQDIALLSPDALDDLAVAHNQLGIIYRNAGQLERALEHYNQAIHYKEQAGDLYLAGQIRFNVAIALANNDRPREALLYARATLHNFEPYGQGAAEDIDNTKELIISIEQSLARGRE